MLAVGMEDVYCGVMELSCCGTLGREPHRAMVVAVVVG